MAATIGLKGGSGTTATIQVNGVDRVTLDTSNVLTMTGEIRATDNVTAYYSSDVQLKENIQPIQNALGIVAAVGGKTFDWTDAYIHGHGGLDSYFLRKQDFGVVAQDLLAVFPVAVRRRQDGYLAVDYERLVAVAFQAIQELTARVEELEKLKDK